MQGTPHRCIPMQHSETFLDMVKVCLDYPYCIENMAISVLLKDDVSISIDVWSSGGMHFHRPCFLPVALH